MDIELFITEIQNRPVIWDQTKREYSDRNLKKQAWEEVCNVFIENFAAKTVKEKNEAGKRHIIFTYTYFATAMTLHLKQNSLQIYPLLQYLTV